MSYIIWCVLLLVISLVGLSISTWFMLYSTRNTDLTVGRFMITLIVFVVSLVFFMNILWNILLVYTVTSDNDIHYGNVVYTDSVTDYYSINDTINKSVVRTGVDKEKRGYFDILVGKLSDRKMSLYEYLYGVFKNMNCVDYSWKDGTSLEKISGKDINKNKKDYSSTMTRDGLKAYLVSGKENNYIVFVGKDLKVDDNKDYVIQYNKGKITTIDGKAYCNMSVIKEG